MTTIEDLMNLMKEEMYKPTPDWLVKVYEDIRPLYQGVYVEIPKPEQDEKK